MTYIPYNKSYFATDIDETVVPGEQLMDAQINERIANSDRMSKRTKEICKHSTGEHLEELKKARDYFTQNKERLQNDGFIGTPEWKEVMKELSNLDNYLFPQHYRAKDMVREELSPEFEGLIDYRKIYVPENIYPGVKEALWAIYEAGIYDFLAGNSQTNSPNEEVAKDFLKGVLPPIEMFYVRFHGLPYHNADGTINKQRPVTDKWKEFVKAHSDINLDISSSVENTPTAYQRALNAGFKAVLVEEESCMQGSMLPCKAIVNAANQMIAYRYPNTKQPIDIKGLVK